MLPLRHSAEPLRQALAAPRLERAIGVIYRPETELCLGLVHFTDGLEGTRRRIAAARKYAKDFSIATECGFGRRKVETIPELLRIHAAAAEL